MVRDMIMIMSSKAKKIEAKLKDLSERHVILVRVVVEFLETMEGSEQELDGDQLATMQKLSKIVLEQCKSQQNVID